MAHEKFVRRQYTDEERARLLHQDKELTEAEKEKVERCKAIIKEMRRRANEALSKQEIHSENTDTPSESREDKANYSRDDR